MFFVDLDCNRRVSVEEVHCFSTIYILERANPPDSVEQIVRDARRPAEDLWPDSPVHLLEPRGNPSAPDQNHDLSVTCAALLVCTQAVNEGYIASCLTVVWFRSARGSEPLEMAVRETVRGIAWEQLARDFDY
jgi:hypothetical protein